MTTHKHYSGFKIELDDDGITIYAVVLSGSEAIEYSKDWLNQQIVNYGFYGLIVIKTAHKEIDELLRNNHSGKVKLGRKIDSKVEIFISNDLLSARLRITSAKGGEHVSTNKVVSVINENKIELGLVNKKSIINLIKKSKHIEPGEIIEAVIAQGIAPEDGKDTRFKSLIDGTAKRKPHERDNGTLDYYDLGEIICVEEGSHLMRKFPPEPAKTGRTVTGEDLIAKKGKLLNFKKCKGAVVNPSDPDLLISTLKGQPVTFDQGVNVDKVLMVKNVNLQTGHISYDGTIIVRGDVASGMKIKVTGDVQVMGIVENASIEAEGNVDIKSGAVGRVGELKNNMQIVCEGNLSAGYLENALVNAKGDVLIKSRISNCKLKAGHQIIVGNRHQEKSGIVGGHVSAGTTIRSRVLGSSSYALTHVEISCDASNLEQFKVLNKEIVVQNKVLMRKLSVMRGASKQPTKEAKQTFYQLKKETEALKITVKNLHDQKDNFKSSAKQASLGEIIALKEAYPGVTIKILDKEHEIKSQYGQGTFLLSNGSIAHKYAIK